MKIRESLLKAANRVLVREGSGNFTIQAVAREANISVEGVLAFFKNEEEIIAGLRESGLALFKSALPNKIDEDDPNLRRY